MQTYILKKDIPKWDIDTIICMFVKNQIMQLTLDSKFATYVPPKSQLLKWVGNKQKFAGQISKYFPANYNTFYEPFLGSGAIMATLSPSSGVGS